MKNLIYCSTNKINGKVYIGQTSRGLAARKAQHKVLYEVTRPNGTIEEVENLNQFCRDNRLDSRHMHAIANKRKRYKTHKQYKCEKVRCLH